MHEYFVQNPVIAIVFMMLVAVIFIVVVVKALQAIGLERIRKIVYQGFVIAEHEFMYGDNAAKFDYVIQLARSHIPLPFSLVITESLLRTVIQAWFDLCKDLLDDGKLNNASNENE